MKNAALLVLFTATAVRAQAAACPPCAAQIALVPVCATDCIESAAVTNVGCVNGDYACQCASSSAIQNAALNCVVSGCGIATGLAVISSVSNISAVPACATGCISSAAVTNVGCVDGDYACQCVSSSAIQNAALNCVVSGCGIATGMAVINSVSNLGLRCLYLCDDKRLWCFHFNSIHRSSGILFSASSIFFSYTLFYMDLQLISTLFYPSFHPFFSLGYPLICYYHSLFDNSVNYHAAAFLVFTSDNTTSGVLTLRSANQCRPVLCQQLYRVCRRNQCWLR
ncbi:hypothetical protein CMQ_5363 [Grosmannia clavigera kw1407]|uniref:CFEM domain-containing protein n=1 Tax=Grosmannia clavigera (strain kw1407 / UAMH 11150) TaxID=655863 RepID=F0XBL6_GROCL|nr:uncharacterized protein CMQ_5363 [Grosmannia clavigera kw1407]EFX05101.1 hypothetical protein CMQ_5363 [Grosmannia clavigera kw1407]